MAEELHAERIVASPEVEEEPVGIKMSYQRGQASEETWRTRRPAEAMVDPIPIDAAFGAESNPNRAIKSPAYEALT